MIGAATRSMNALRMAGWLRSASAALACVWACCAVGCCDFSAHSCLQDAVWTALLDQDRIPGFVEVSG